LIRTVFPLSKHVVINPLNDRRNIAKRRLILIGILPYVGVNNFFSLEENNLNMLGVFTGALWWFCPAFNLDTVYAIRRNPINVVI
jgi:hypothetical protein